MKKHITAFLVWFAGSFSAQTFVTTYAGNGTPALINGDTATARFKSPFGICIDKSGNLFVADGGNHCVRKITSAGIVSIHAGTGIAGYLDGLAASAQFNNPTGVCVDDSGNVYVSDFLNHRIRKISYSGSVTTIAGNGTPGYTDASAASAQFNYPRGICRSKNGNLFVGDSWNHRIRKIDVNGNVTTYAGGGVAMGVSSIGGWVDAKDTAARFYTPAGVSIDKNNNVFVADAYNHRIRRIDTARQVTTIAGSGPTGVGNGGYANGPVASALLNTPTELHTDSAGSKIYIGDTFNNRVRVVNSGSLTNLAGKGTTGYVDGLDTVAQFNYTRGVVSNANGSIVYVVDYNNHAIRKITSPVSDVGLTSHSKEKPELFVLPNPNNGVFGLGIKNTSIAEQIKISDITGKVVYSKNNFNFNSKIEVDHIPTGVYSIEIVTGASYRIAKFVKF